VFAAQSVAAAGTFSAEFPQVQKGVAGWYVTPGDATGSLDFQVVLFDSTGTTVVGVLDELGKPAATIRGQSVIPDGGTAPGNITGILVTNADAGGAHSFSAAFSVNTNR
jgi:hypothetical protein